MRWAIAGIAVVAAIASSTLQAQQPSAGEWALLGGNANVWHYSALSQIDTANVKDLGLSWVADMPTRDGLVGNPLVKDGVVFLSGALGRIYANDVRTGKLVWQFSPNVDFSDKLSLAAFYSLRVNRGLALLDDKVFVASGDCRLFAVDAKTGKELWRAVSCDSTKQMGITGAPRVGAGKVFIGNNCADTGAERGFVEAFDARTGRRSWRFYTMPGDPSQPFESKTMEMASKTWGTHYWEKTHGCVSPYDGITYDEKLNLVYFGTAGPAPFNPKERAADAGDELFSNSIVAVNASTGEYVWHYQTVQHDAWNLDATWQITIAELPVKGVKRRVVMTAPKNGFFYVLDAKTGAFLSAGKYTDINWASHVDPKTGRPVTLPDARYWERPNEETIAAPGPAGAHSWHADSWNPNTGLIYFNVMHAPAIMRLDPEALIGGVAVDIYFERSGSRSRWPKGGELIAWNPLTQSARWRVKRDLAVNGGVLSTAGNLVFQGSGVGTFDAFDARSGKPLWSFNARGCIQAAPTAVQIDGEQLILVPSGNCGSSGLGLSFTRLSSTLASRAPSRLLAFKLGGKGTLPPVVIQAFPKPPLLRPDAKLAKDGGQYFDAQFCTTCHGLEAENARSSVPDLRMANGQTHEQFAAIVLGGLRRDKGMPAFPQLPLTELKAIQAYILDRAWTSYEEQESGKSDPAHH